MTSQNTPENNSDPKNTPEKHKACACIAHDKVVPSCLTASHPCWHEVLSQTRLTQDIHLVEPQQFVYIFPHFTAWMPSCTSLCSPSLLIAGTP